MRRLIPISALLIFLFGNASAAVTQRRFGAVSFSAFVSAASCAWTHIHESTTTCPHSLLVIDCGNDASTVTQINFAGVQATSRVALTSTETQQIWSITNSTMSGSGTITATFGAAVDGYCDAVTYCGADDNSPSDAIATAQTTQTNPNIAVTVVSSGSAMVGSMFNNGTTLVPNTGQSNIFNAQFNAGGPASTASQFQGFQQAGSQTLSWTQPTSAAWTKAIWSIKPSTGTPIPTTQNMTAVTQTSATGNGTILFWGGNTITAQGICYNTAGNPTTSDTCVTGSGTPFTASLTGLTPGQAYHARAYATNSEGTDYGIDVPFVTLAPKGLFANKGIGKTTADLGSASSVMR